MSEIESSRNEILKRMRREIWANERLNLMKKIPKKDSDMVEEVMKVINRQVSTEKDL